MVRAPDGTRAYLLALWYFQVCRSIMTDRHATVRLPDGIRTLLVLLSIYTLQKSLSSGP